MDYGVDLAALRGLDAELELAGTHLEGLPLGLVGEEDGLGPNAVGGVGGAG